MLSFMPVRYDAGMIGIVRRSDTKGVSNVLERDAVRDVLTLLEKGFSKCKADQLANLGIGPISPVGQRESGERRAGKRCDVEVTEQVRGNLLSKLVDVVPGGGRVERSPVDHLERPGSDPDRHIGATGTRSLRVDRLQPDVGKGTPDVGKDLYDWT